MVDLSPKFGLSFLAEGGAGHELYVNENAVIQEAMTSIALTDRDLATPPGSPATGVTYLIAGSPTGLWSGQAGKLTVWTGTRWVFITPVEGLRARVLDENVFISYDGASWTTEDYIGAAAVVAFVVSSLQAQKFQAVRVATTGNVNLSTGLENGDTIDGITLVTGDLVLVKSQSTASQNGIYTVPASGAASRTPGSDTSAAILGQLIWVFTGNNGRQMYVNANSAPPTVGSTNLVYLSLQASFPTQTLPIATLHSGASGDGRLIIANGVEVTYSDEPSEGTVPYFTGGIWTFVPYSPP